MNSSKNSVPVVLSLAGHDPGGGAGIQADIESIIANYCRPVSVITSLTAQNSRNLLNIYPQKPKDFRTQLELLEEDVKFDAIKIGVIGSLELLNEIVKLLERNQSLPVVFDPVINSSTGDSFMGKKLMDKIKSDLLPLVSILTPNSIEARELSQKNDSLETAAEELLNLGCSNVLITGTHETSDTVINTLYENSKLPRSFEFNRLPAEFHGSGCTLSAAIAAQLATGIALDMAVKNALDYTWQSLTSATVDSENHGIPKRIQ